MLAVSLSNLMSQITMSNSEYYSGIYSGIFCEKFWFMTKSTMNYEFKKKERKDKRNY